jgi:hypothetical protein
MSMVTMSELPAPTVALPTLLSFLESFPILSFQNVEMP